MNVIFSNRVENLMEQLAGAIGQPVAGAGVLTPEYVLVDNKVLGQWINLQLASRHGIAANIEYLQPSALFWKIAQALLADELPRETPLLKEEMTWRLFTLLGDDALVAEPAMLPVRNYLAEGDCGELKRFQLAGGIADLFDQYLIYRPGWLLGWQQGRAADLKPGQAGHEAWQCRLWQRLTAGERERNWHRAAIESRLLALLSGERLSGRMPFGRLLVFGISSMSPSLLALLAGLGRHIEVTLYVLNPCREYWGLVSSAKAQARRQGGVALYDEIGNPLLASQGVQVQEMIELLQGSEVAGLELQESDCFDEIPAPATLLQAIQQEILALQYRGVTARDIDDVSSGARQPVPAADLDVKNRIPSLHIHLCHSARREVEVLHDQVRDMLARNPDWNPRDIVVMMPRVASYVPYIHAVFNSVAEKDRIPFHITDRTLAEESPLLNSFVSLLAIADSRLPLSEVLALLEVTAVQQRFGLDQSGFEQLRQWLVASGARWGVDRHHRQALGLPDYHEYSWQFAIDRLLAGYGIAVPDPLAPAGLLALADDYAVMPFAGIEGGNAGVLDSFLQFWDQLQALRTAVASPRSPGQWHLFLLQLLQDFYAADEEDDLRALTVLRSAIGELKHAAERHWCDAAVGMAVIRDLLKPALQQTVQGRHSWQEGIKFCSLLPMRAVPFRVVYIMGMNQADYPRQVERKSFDLMRNNHRPGDRASRIDDRWLFLEALLSARDLFHLSYVARDMHRNEKREPSVVLAELTDYLAQGYCLPSDDRQGNDHDRDAGKNMDDWLYTRHPLQPFGACYFSAGKDAAAHRLLSYDREAFAIASARTGPEPAIAAPARWFRTAQQEQETIEISLTEFVRFFTKPWEWLLSTRFRLALEVTDDGVEDDEPFAIDPGLESWGVRHELLARVNGQPEGEDGFAAVLNDYVAVRKGRAEWPLGHAGDLLRADLASEAVFFYASHDRPVCLRPFAYVYQDEQVLLRIQGQLPVHVAPGSSTAQLLLHTPSRFGQRRDKLLELFIRFAMAWLARGENDEAKVMAAEAIFRDSTQAISAGLAAQMRWADFMQLLARLYLDYRACGLPFDLDIAQRIAGVAGVAGAAGIDSDEAADVALQEVADDYWYGAEQGEGAAADIWKQLYFGSCDAITDPHFVETCCRIQAFLDEFWQQLQEEKTANRKKGGQH